ncbi:unnamed protein product [Prunus armeniaca]
MLRSLVGLMMICLTYPQRSSATSSTSPLPINLSDRSAIRMMPNDMKPCVQKLTSLKPSALSGRLRTLSGLQIRSWFGRPKANGEWRMCQDYTDLNKACPKDSFALPRIDQLVDATASHELLSFMDAYSGYNQIFMHPGDCKHTTFIMDRGLYYYNVMPFSLKNAGATYQRLVNRIFAMHIGSIMEVHVDDIVVKSQTAEGHLENLALMLGILKDYRMRLNPTKYAFGVSSGQRGIEANPEKIKVIIDMERPKTQKDIQSLTGRAFQDLKNYMSKAPLLSKTTSRRSSPSLPFGIKHCRQLTVDTEAREGRTIDILCQQSAVERRALVSPLGAASTSPRHLNSKAPPILPTTRDHGFDQSTTSASATKARNVQPIDQMGN